MSEVMAGLTEGRIVHFVLNDGPNVNQHRSAIIVKVWSDQTHQGCCNMMVFMDGNNDGNTSWLQWKTSVRYSEDKEPGTWHWIERA